MSVRGVLGITLALLFGTQLFGCGDEEPTEPATVASVEVAPATDTLTALGETCQFTAVAEDADGNKISGRTFSWSSSDEAVATVAATGLATAVARGTATIRATTAGVSGSASLTVDACLTPPSGMVGWWPGDGTADDIVGDNHGTLESGATFGTGLVGEAFSLDGQDDFVDVPHSAELNFGTGDFTVDFWINFRSIEGESVMVEKWIQKFSENPMGWIYTKMGGSLRFSPSSADLGEVWIDVVPPSIPTDTWIHAAASRANNTYTMYWNGESIRSETLGLTYNIDSNSSLKFGHRGNPDDTPGSEDWSGYYLNGLIDEVGLYNRALSAEEIQAIFDVGRLGKCKP